MGGARRAKGGRAVVEYNVLLNKRRRASMMNRCHSQHSLPLARTGSVTTLGNTAHPHQITLKKSIFNPPPGLEHVYRQRQHITGVSVPAVSVLFSSPRWLLLSAPRYSHKFFRRLNAGRLGPPHAALLQVFAYLVRLSQLYGYFGVTAEMILMRGQDIYVWINEDIFAEIAMYPLRYGVEGEKEFVGSFVQLLARNFDEWQQGGPLFTVRDVTSLLSGRQEQQQAKGIQTSTETVKKAHIMKKGSMNEEDFMRQNDQSQLRPFRSTQTMPIIQDLELFQEELSSSLTIKQLEKRNMLPPKRNESQFKNNETLQFKKLPGKAIEGSGEVRQTKKNFNLISLSPASLQRSSEKVRTTAARRPVLQQSSGGSVMASGSVKMEGKEGSEGVKLELNEMADELDGLFGSERHELVFGEEGDRQQLQKITQEMEDMLIW